MEWSEYLALTGALAVSMTGGSISLEWVAAFFLYPHRGAFRRDRSRALIQSRPMTQALETDQHRFHFEVDAEARLNGSADLAGQRQDILRSCAAAIDERQSMPG